MTDTLLQNLTELTSPAATDLLYMVADPTGTPLDRKVQFSTVLDRAKGYSTILDASGKGDYTDLAAALAALSAGDVLFIRNGTYAGGVTIDTAEVTIIGETRNGVIIQSLPNNSAPAITVTAEKVTLQNFKIDGLRDTQGTGDADTTTFAGVRITADGIIIENVWVFEPYGMGISAAADDGRITNCLVENRATDGVTPVEGKFGYGIVVYGGSRWTIAYNRVTGFSQACGLWWGCSDNVVAFNRFIANYGYITALPGAGGTRSAIEDYGADIINYRNIWIGNVIDGSTSECIECAQGVIGSQFVSNYCTNANKFGDNTGRGFVIQTGASTQPTRDIVFRDNAIIGDGATGRMNGGYVQTIGTLTLEGNSFLNCHISGASGVIMAGGADTRLVLRGNTFRGCKGGALRIYAQQPALIEGNSVFEVADNSPVFNIADDAGLPSSRHVIQGNFVNGSGAFSPSCIQITGGAYHRITHNTFHCSVGSGVDVRVNYCTITHNHFRTDADTVAVLIDGSAVGTVLMHNTIDSNSATAIYLNGAGVTHSIVQENTLIGASAEVHNHTGNATNQLGPNHTGTFSRIVGVLKSLGAQTVGGTQATITHGLAYTPTEIQITMTSAGTIWKSAASDGTNIYLTADTTGRTAEVFVR
jgi:hypothetical protein